MKTLFYASLTATGFGLFQLLGFIATAYPITRSGAILFIILGQIAILILGFANWCGLKNENYWNDSASIWTGFAPAIALGAVAIVAIIFGIHSALG